MGLDVSLGLAKNVATIALGSDVVFAEESVIYIGVTGNVKVDAAGVGTGITFKNIPAGTVLPVMVKKVYSTANGTTATDLIRLY